MPVAVNMPGRQEKKDPLDKLASALNVVQSGFGIYSDLQKLDAYKQNLALETARKAQEDKKTGLEIQNLERGQATAAEDDNPNSPLVGTAEKPGPLRLAAKKRGIILPEGTTPKQARTNFDAFLKPNDPKPVDPFVEEMRRDKAEEAKRLKTPRGKLEKMGADQKQRFDNVVLGIDAITGMEKALTAGDWTFSMVGDNDYTRNAAKWDEAIGRMQSGGAINDKEATRFRAMVPGAKDSADIQQKKLADMRVIMEQRFGTFGFNKSQAADLGLDPARLGWAPQPGQTEGMGLGAGGAAPKPKTIKQGDHVYTLDEKTGEYK